ncbi:MAG: ABC transporter substrate-binding protein [Dysosmobacter sp.]|nr:ABC transporter substrate-binding protein [Dysosmobacter sp.]
MKKTRTLSMLLAVVLLLGLLAGCKRNEETTSSEPPANPTPGTTQSGAAAGSPDVVSQGVTEDTVKIGTISLVSGAFAYIGQPAYDGMRAAIARLNAQGGVQGHQIEIVAYDDQYDAATGKATIERFVEQDQVFLLTSLWGNIVEPSLDYLKDKGIPVINIASGLDVCFAENDPSSHIFQVQPANRTDARFLLARVLHESIFGANKDEKLPSDAKIAVVHGVDSASMDNLGHLQAMAEEEGALDRLVCEAVTQETYATAIQKFKGEECQVVIFMGIDATTWISAMDDAQWEVPVIFSYGASTLQSFVPDTYKSTRPCYANVWADYASAGGQAMLDDMMDALSYCPDIAEDVRLSYRDNNYCVAGYLYGMTIVKAFERLNEMQDDYGLNWDDFSAVMEMGDFEMGAVTFDFANGKRMGVDAMALLEYVGDPATGNEEMVNLLPFADLDTVLSK